MIISLSVKSSKPPRHYLSADHYVLIFFLVHHVPFQAVNSSISSLVYDTGKPPFTKRTSVYVFLASGLPPLLFSGVKPSPGKFSSPTNPVVPVPILQKWLLILLLSMYHPQWKTEFLHLHLRSTVMPLGVVSEFPTIQQTFFIYCGCSRRLIV